MVRRNEMGTKDRVKVPKLFEASGKQEITRNYKEGKAVQAARGTNEVLTTCAGYPMRGTDSSLMSLQERCSSRECSYWLEQRIRGSDLAGNYSFGSHAYATLETGHIAWRKCASRPEKAVNLSAKPKRV